MTMSIIKQYCEVKVMDDFDLGPILPGEIEDHDLEDNRANVESSSNDFLKEEVNDENECEYRVFDEPD